MIWLRGREIKIVEKSRNFFCLRRSETRELFECLVRKVKLKNRKLVILSAGEGSPTKANLKTEFQQVGFTSHPIAQSPPLDSTAIPTWASLQRAFKILYMPISVSGQQVTFTPPEGAIGLIGDFTDWFKQEAILTSGEDLTLTLPRGAWVEFAWVNAQGEAFADPEHDQKSLNPWWSYPRAVLVGEYKRHALWQGPEATQTGEAHRLTWQSKIFPGTRRAIVYTPYQHQPNQPLPIYYVQDGVAFYRTGKLGEVMDRAVEHGLAQKAVLVFIEPNNRDTEYYLNDRYLEFLTTEVFPQVEGVHAQASLRGLWGASLGGLISLYLGSQHPELFSRVVSHSGAFIASPNASKNGTINTTTTTEWLYEQIKSNPPKHLKTSLDTGVIEWLTGPNRRMASLFADLFLEHQYREYPSGHNWVTWREALPEAFLYTQN